VVNAKDRSLESLRLEIESLYKDIGTWEGVGNHYGVNRTTAWRIARDDYEPRKYRIRRLLGLPQIITREQPRDREGRFASLSD